MHYDKKCKYPQSQVDALTYLLIIYTHEKNWSQAEEKIVTALDIARNNSQLYRLSKMLIVCGNLFEAQGKWENAASYYTTNREKRVETQATHRPIEVRILF